MSFLLQPAKPLIPNVAVLGGRDNQGVNRHLNRYPKGLQNAS